MKRREFIALAAGMGALPFVPQAVYGEAERTRRMAVLMSLIEEDAANRFYMASFRNELEKSGWTEGRNIRSEIRWANAEDDKIGHAVQELIAFQPDVIVTQNTPTTLAMWQRTREIPVVFTNVSDPIGEGFVVSLSRPGGNVTGFIDIEAAMGGKWLELLKEISPGLARVATIFNPGQRRVVVRISSTRSGRLPDRRE
jgi:putative tryptophan/tyrosine transport system substrate-binding protein